MRRLLPRCAPLLAAVLLPSLAAAAGEAPCAAGDRACAERAVRAHAARTLDFWVAELVSPLDERGGAASPALVDFLRLDAAAQGRPGTVVAARLDPGFLADVRGAMAEMPPEVRRLLGGSFAGAWFVEGLGRPGMAVTFLEGPDTPAGAFVVLDARALRGARANAWATARENARFRPQPGWKLAVRLEEPAGDTRRAALRYALLVELGRVVAATRAFHPPADPVLREPPPGASFPFTDVSWTLDRAAGRYVARANEALLGPPPGLATKDIAATCAALDRGSFPTLGAAASPADDFAESFANYVHAVILKRPWEVVVSKEGRRVAAYAACWDDPRCVEKREMLENLLRLPPPSRPTGGG